MNTAKTINILEYAVTPESGETINLLLNHKNIKINKIVSSDDIDHIEYCQDEDEWILLLEGSATLECDGKVLELKRGDSLLIPSKTTHRVKKVEKGTIWLTVHIY